MILLKDLKRFMEEAARAEPLSSQKQAFETTAVIGEDAVEIEVGFDDLRRNLVREARAQGLSEKRIREVVEGITFDIFENGQEVSDCLEGDNHRQIAQGFRSWLSRQTKKPPTEVAAIEPQGDGTHTFHFNMGEIIALITENQVPNFRLSADAPAEAKQMLITQALDSIWRHERQHLIQAMDPGKQEKILKEMKIANAVHKVSLRVLAGMPALILVSTRALIPEQMRAPLFLSLTIGGAVVAVAANLNFTRFRQWSAHEREARAHQKSDHWQSASPFQVRFENAE